MPNREEKYWLLRKQNVSKPNGKRRAPETLVDFFLPRHGLTQGENLKESISGIELGCGEGHLLDVIAKSHLSKTLNIKLDGLDRDSSALSCAKELYPQINFLNYDLRKEWHNGLQPYDFVMIVNVIHEIVSEVLLENKKASNHLSHNFALNVFQQLLLKCYSILNPHSVLILFDGVDTQDHSLVEFHFKDPNGLELLHMFANEFRFCDGSMFVSSPTGKIQMSKRDLLRFLTKYDAIVNNTWGIERNEIYQTFTYDEMANTIRKAGFSLIHTELTIADLKSWESLIEPVTSFEFPFQHVLIAGVKYA